MDPLAVPNVFLLSVLLIVIIYYIIRKIQKRRKPSNQASQSKGTVELHEDSGEVVASQAVEEESIFYTKRDISFWKSWKFWMSCMISAFPVVWLSMYAVVESGRPSDVWGGLGAFLIWLFAGLYLMIGFVVGIACTLFMRQRETAIGIWVGWCIGLAAFIIARFL